MFTFFVLIAIALIFGVESVVPKDPDDGRDMIEITINKGYPIEEHFVTTEDGYILGLFRIPYARNESSNALNSGKPVVLLQHGLLDSSFTFVNNFPDESLAFLYADKGYDVWLGNNRGNTYSKRHAWLDTNTDEYWNFTYDEMAKYDTPNTIDYILTYTNFTQLAYIGHSQGTLQMFAMPTHRPDMLPKIAYFGALAPVAYVNHLKSPVFLVLADLDVAYIYEIFGRKQVLPGIYILNNIAPELCQILPTGCDEMLWLIAGPTQDLNDSRIQVYVSETPADTSVKNMIHWTQGVKHNKFQMYDYGSKAKNEEHYGPNYPEPPQYNISAVTMNMGLYSGTNDWLADPKDVQHLTEFLPTNKITQDVVVNGFAHLDFVWGMHVNTSVYLQPNLYTQIVKYLGPGKFVA